MSHPVAMARRPLPAWPLDALLWGFPLWWILGLTPFVAIGFAAIMLALMLIRRGIRLTPGVTPWLAFVVWVLACSMMLDSPDRLVGYAQRTSNFIAVAIVLVYVVNARELLTKKRVVAGLTALWVTVVIGGYLGVIYPEGRLTTPMGVLLPGRLTGNEYVADLVFPPFAEVQQPWGVDQAYYRPAAPFPYTNGWGQAIVFLTPVALAQFLTTESQRLRIGLAVMAVAAVVPAAATLNRGLFIGLGVIAVYMAVRLLWRGYIAPFAAIAVGAIVAGIAFVQSGVLDDLMKRAEYGSTEGRAQLYSETFRRTLESPLLGYGAPRPSETLNVSAGTQGHLWMLMFSFGFVGLLLFLWFLYGAVLRTWRVPTRTDLLLHSTLVAACVTMTFYGIDTMQMVTLAVVGAVLLRDAADRRAAHRDTEALAPWPARAIRRHVSQAR